MATLQFQTKQTTWVPKYDHNKCEHGYQTWVPKNGMFKQMKKSGLIEVSSFWVRLNRGSLVTCQFGQFLLQPELGLIDSTWFLVPTKLLVEHTGLCMIHLVTGYAVYSKYITISIVWKLHQAGNWCKKLRNCIQQIIRSNMATYQ